MIVIFGGGSDIAAAVQELQPHNTRLVPKGSWNVKWALGMGQRINEGDHVVNCAGVSSIYGMNDIPLPDLIDEVETNLLGSFFVARAAIERRAASMTFIASVAGMYGKPHHAGYCASKAGVISLVQSLGMEGYRAYCISPGRVDTKMRERDYPGEDRRTRLTPHQVAREILKCIEGKYLPGDNIIIRKIGYRTYRKIDRGEPWKTYLKVKPK